MVHQLLMAYVKVLFFRKKTSCGFHHFILVWKKACLLTTLLCAHPHFHFLAPVLIFFFFLPVIRVSGFLLVSGSQKNIVKSSEPLTSRSGLDPLNDL